MTNCRQKSPLGAPANRWFSGLQETFHWFDDALNRFQQELVALPELTQELPTEDILSINLSERLVRIKTEIKTFKKDLSRSRWNWPPAQDYNLILSTDLPPSEWSALQTINQHFAVVTEKIESEATAIAKTLDARLANHTDVMWDYEINATCHFVLREDDPGYSENSDNFLAMRDLFIAPCVDNDTDAWKFMGCDWPNGYATDPLPHGLLFHDLHYYESTVGESPPQSLKDIQRIGDVWVDLIVRFQFYYDLVQGKWVKAFYSDSDDKLRVYAQEPSAP